MAQGKKGTRDWNLIDGNCKECGKSFRTFPSKKKRYCNNTCAAVHKVGGRFLKGIMVWNKGLKGFRSGEKRPGVSPVGDKNTAWKGDDVKYRALHSWVERTLGKPMNCWSCEREGTGRQIHWANKSRTYKRVTTDWIRLCAKCHKAYDGNRLALSF